MITGQDVDKAGGPDGPDRIGDRSRGLTEGGSPAAGWR